MTDTYNPELTSLQIINSIYYYTPNGTWAPGIAFPSGPQRPAVNQDPGPNDPHEGDFFFLTTSPQHLYQLQINDQTPPTLGWVDLQTDANAIPAQKCGQTLPLTGSFVGDLFNKYDNGNIYNNGNIYQWISVYDQDQEEWVPGWQNIGSNGGGLPLGADAITFTDLSKTWRSVRLGMLLTTDTGSSPLLATDCGFVVKKDITAGGFVGANQGELWLGHGRLNATDNPKIVLVHSGQNYDTLYLTKADCSTPAHLDLDNLTAHGNLTVETQLEVKSTNSKFAVTAGDNGANQDTYLIPQNPSQGGLGLGTSEYPFKFVDTTSLFTTSIQNYQTNNPPITINSTLAFGNNPFTISSTNTITNLNADLLDGHHASDFVTSQWNGGTVTNAVTAPSFQPSGTNAWIISQDSTKLYLAVTGVTNGLTIDTSGNVITAGNFSPLGTLFMPSGNDIYWSTDLHLHRSAAGVIQVLDGSNALGTIDASNVFTDHLNSASAGGIYIMDTVKFYGTNFVILPSGGSLYFGVTGVSNGLSIDGSGNVTNAGNLLQSGTVTMSSGSDIYWSTDVHIHRAASGVLQCLDGSGNLATWESSNIKADHWTAASGGDMYFMNNMRAYSALNIMPNANNSGNIGGNGSSTNYYWGAVWSNYIKYKNAPSSFDAYDDLDLVRKMKTTLIEGKDVIDPETTKHLIDDHGFYESSRMDGWHLSIQRKVVEKLDENKAADAELLDRIERLSAEVKELKTRLVV